MSSFAPVVPGRDPAAAGRTEYGARAGEYGAGSGGYGGPSVLPTTVSASGPYGRSAVPKHDPRVQKGLQAKGMANGPEDPVVAAWCCSEGNKTAMSQQAWLAGVPFLIFAGIVAAMMSGGGLFAEGGVAAASSAIFLLIAGCMAAGVIMSTRARAQQVAQTVWILTKTHLVEFCDARVLGGAMKTGADGQTFELNTLVTVEVDKRGSCMGSQAMQTEYVGCAPVGGGWVRQGNGDNSTMRYQGIRVFADDSEVVANTIRDAKKRAEASQTTQTAVAHAQAMQAALGGTGAIRGSTAAAGAGEEKEDIPAKIADLKRLLDQGILSQAEFDAKKADLLARM